MTRRKSSSPSDDQRRSHDENQMDDKLTFDHVKERRSLLRKHRMLQRATGFMLATKYRNGWHDDDFELSPRESFSKSSRKSSSNRRPNPTAKSARLDARLDALVSSSSFARGYTLEELLNFWKDLPLSSKRPLLRIHRSVYVEALNRFLIRQKLCCECHDNVLQEWGDHEHRRSGSRSLQEMFNVHPAFPPEDESSESGWGDESEDEMIVESHEVVFTCEMHRQTDGTSRTVVTSRSSLPPMRPLEASDVTSQDRYIVIREDHPGFVLDLIRYGDQFSFLSSLDAAFDEFESDWEEEESEEEEEEDLNECPGANTPHLAQEFILEVLAIKFREQLEDAYQAALQHSLAVQAELLRDEIADLRASQKTVPKKRKNKEKKKRKKKEKQEKVEATPKSEESDQFEESPDEVDKEVEAFRLRLEEASVACPVEKPKLVLPPGTFLPGAN